MFVALFFWWMFSFLFVWSMLGILFIVMRVLFVRLVFIISFVWSRFISLFVWLMFILFVCLVCIILFVWMMLARMGCHPIPQNPKTWPQLAQQFTKVARHKWGGEIWLCCAICRFHHNHTINAARCGLLMSNSMQMLLCSISCIYFSTTWSKEWWLYFSS